MMKAKKMLSLLLVFAMAVSFLPAGVWADSEVTLTASGGDTFEAAVYGYEEHPSVKSITITNGTQSELKNWSVTNSNPDDFTDGWEMTPDYSAPIGADATIEGYGIYPNTGLGVGTHIATITLTYYLDGDDNAHTATVTVSFTVNGVPETAPTAGLTVTGDDSGELSGLTAEAAYILSGAGVAADTERNADAEGKIAIAGGLTAGTLSVVKKATDANHANSAAQEITVSQGETPTELAGVAPTTDAGSDGKITGLDPETSYQYRLTTGNGWTDCSGADNIPGLASGTYYVRTSWTTSKLPSDPASVTVPAYQAPAGYALTVTSEHGTVHVYNSQDTELTGDELNSIPADTALYATVTPAEGYCVNTVKYNDGEAITATEGKYSFTTAAAAAALVVTYAQTYTVTLHPNTYAGASGVDVVFENQTSPFTLPTGINPEWNWAAPQGKVFDCWNDDAEHEYREVTTIPLTGNLELWALWKDAPAQTYTVTLISSTGTTSNAQILLQDQTNPFTLPTEMPDSWAEPAGKVFGGWSAVEGGEKIEADSITLQTDTSYYAVWVDGWKISFLLGANSALAEGSGALIQKPVKDSAITTITVKPEEGFDFPGDDFSAWLSALGNTTNDLNISLAEGKLVISGTPSGDVTITLPDAAQVYTVNLYPNGAKDTQNPEENGVTQVLEETSPFTLPEAPNSWAAPQGKVFAGWAYEANATEPLTGPTIDLTGETDLYAVWADATYTVTLYPNGATGNNVVLFDQSSPFTLPTQINGNWNWAPPQGKIFAGWAESEQGDKIPTAMIDLTGPKTLYAVWSPVYTVTLFPNGALDGSGYEIGDNGRISFENQTSPYTLPELPEGWNRPEGKIFCGWDDGESLVPIQPGSQVDLTNDADFSASWKTGYVADFTLGDYSELGNADPNVNVLHQEKRTGYSLTQFFVEPEDGYAFTGEAVAAWRENNKDALEDAGITVSLTGDGSLSIYTEVALGADITLTLPAAEALYTVSFDAGNDDATGEMDDVETVAAYKLPACEYKLEGYKFDGWQIGGTEMVKKAGATITLTEDVTLTATWAKAYVVTVDANIEHGKIRLDGEAPYEFAEGEEVWLWVTPDEHYEIDTVSYTVEGDNTPHPVPVFTNRTLPGMHGMRYPDYSFDMPEGNVTVTATFKKLAIWTLTIDPNGAEGKYEGQPAEPIVLEIEGKLDLTSEPLPENVEAAMDAIEEWGFSEDEDLVLAGLSTSTDVKDLIDVSQPIAPEEGQDSLTLYVLWGYRVYFNANGGSFTGVPRRSVVSGEKATKPEDPTYDGHKFLGWYEVNELGNLAGEPFDFENTPIVKKIELRAKWVELYAVTFDKNSENATGEMKAAEVAKGDPYYAPACAYEREGYLFAGWKLQGDAHDVVYQPGDLIVKKASAVLTLIAQWQKVQYTVSFNKGEAEVDGRIEPKAFDVGDTYTVPWPDDNPATMPAAWTNSEAWIFLGWKVNDEDELLVKGAQITIDKSITLYAQWKKNLSITFVYGDGTTPNSVVYLAENTEFKTDPAELATQLDGATLEPTRNGYKFVDWYETDPKTGALARKPFQFSGKVTEDLILTAKWEQNFTVTFDKGAANAELVSGEIPAYETNASPTGVKMALFDPTRPVIDEENQMLVQDAYYRYANHRFIGWKENGTGELIAIPESGDWVYTVTKDVVLVAQWVELVTLTVDADGATDGAWFPMDPGTGQRDTSAEIKFEQNAGMVKLPEIVREIENPVTGEMEEVYMLEKDGYRFAGWKVGYDNETVYQPGDEVEITADVTIYAQWTKIWTVKYYDEKSGLITLTVYFKQEVDDGKTATPPEAPTKDYSAFAGWYEVVDFVQQTGTVTLANEPFDFDKPITDNVQLVAVWSEEGVYAVQFNAGGADGGKMADDFSATSPYTLPECGYTWEGHTFLGWLKDNKGEPIAPGTEVELTDDVTFYAAWSAVVLPTLNVTGNGSYVQLSWNAGVGTEQGVIIRVDSHGNYVQISGWVTLSEAGEYYDWSVEAGETYTYVLNCEVGGVLDGTHLSNWYAVEIPASALVIPTLSLESGIAGDERYTRLSWNAGVGTERGVIVRVDSQNNYVQVSGWVTLSEAGEYYDWSVEAGESYTYVLNCEVDGVLDGTHLSNWYAVTAIPNVAPVMELVNQGGDYVAAWADDAAEAAALGVQTFIVVRTNVSTGAVEYISGYLDGNTYFFRDENAQADVEYVYTLYYTYDSVNWYAANSIDSADAELVV